MKKSIVERASDNIRLLTVAMVEAANSGHPGGAMGGADFITILYSEFLNFDPDDMSWPFRDRLILDPGHMSPMLYSVLTLLGKYTIDEIKQFRQWGSVTHGHPELNVLRGIENTSGPLGIGHAMGLGIAIAERFYAQRFGEWLAHKTYNYISDGGIQEEISQGVGRLAGHLGLANYILFYDSNDIQLSHGTEVVSSEDTAKKYESWGWRTEIIDGHNADEIRGALKRANEETEKPTLIVGKTIIGKGILDARGHSFEGQCSTHGMPISGAGASVEKTIHNLGGNPDEPFAIFKDVAEYFKKVITEKKNNAKKSKTFQKRWTSENPDLAAKLHSMLHKQIPHVDFDTINQKSDIATRVASGVVLSRFAEQIENIIVSSADLSNSDNTNRFLAKTKEFKKHDFTGKFLQIGVAELTMASVMNGIALHGGIVTICGTFFVFSDYMKPAVRLAALMALPVKYVWTHDSFRVGEDGPTHQPIEQEAQIRLLEKMNNLEGKRSMLVLRPADEQETTLAWKIALENYSSPTALLLSRQKIATLPATSNSTRYKDSHNAYKGAYTIQDVENATPDLILVGNGSEVSLLFQAAGILTSTHRIKIRIVSAISEGLFREQPLEYQQSILPATIPTFGLTAGIADSIKGLVGPFGKVFGMNSFGSSAPNKVLDEKYGFTPENIVKQILQYINEYKELTNQFRS